MADYIPSELELIEKTERSLKLRSAAQRHYEAFYIKPPEGEVADKWDDLSEYEKADWARASGLSMGTKVE